MSPFKIPKPIELKKRLKELIEEGLRRDQLPWASWCSNCDYLWFGYKEWPKACTCCNQYFRGKYHRVNSDGIVTIHFK